MEEFVSALRLSSVVVATLTSTVVPLGAAVMHRSPSRGPNGGDVFIYLRPNNALSHAADDDSINKFYYVNMKHCVAN